MIIGNRELAKAAWHKPTINTDAIQKDSLSNLAAQPLPSQSVSSKSETSTGTGADDQGTFDEAFAKMMINLKMATATSGDAAITAEAAPASSSAIAATNNADTARNNLSLSLNQDSSTTEKSATEKFVEYMNQSDAEKAREQLTGVSKEEYEKMSPEEQASLDKKVDELTKERTKVEQEVVRAKIAIAKAELA